MRTQLYGWVSHPVIVKKSSIFYLLLGKECKS